MKSYSFKSGRIPDGSLLSRALHGGIRSIVSLFGVLAGASPAAAHVKWFAPFIVEAPPAPVSSALSDQWVWLGIALTFAFFLTASVIEKSPLGDRILAAMDVVSDPLWTRIDDFVRAIIGAFFIAIFAVGGVYLTPDLATPAEWVSWLQLLIAFGVFSRRTMPFSAAGIILLWVLALRDYDFFHLLDYLALGISIAAYLVLASFPKRKWFKYRLEVLRWGVAIALMWSSLEKLAFAEWFSPLVVEKPYLTFGLPAEAFIPMAGVAEFTMGFGLLWTPLIRRLSAVALFIIFNAAVYPFGRIDLIGHALIMAVIVVIAVDHTRELDFLPHVKRSLIAIPAGLVATMFVFSTGYWGIHSAFYGPYDRTVATTGEISTHSYNPEHPHGPKSKSGIGAPPNARIDEPAGPAAEPATN